MWKHLLVNKNGIPAEVNTDAGEDTGLVVATRDHKTYTTKTVFFTNDTYGREMAQDALYGGTALLLHDGTDTGAWLFSEPVGTKWVADSTDRFYADSKALKCNNPNINDIMQSMNQILLNQGSSDEDQESFKQKYSWPECAQQTLDILLSSGKMV